MSFLYFLLLLGALVFFHELGHFIVAKLSDVKVDAFSIGFGPALLKKRWGETEYRISIIPLGGYVKMLGEDPEMDALQSDYSKKKDKKGEEKKGEEKPAEGKEEQAKPVESESEAFSPIERMEKEAAQEEEGSRRFAPGHPDWGRALNQKPLWKRTLIVVAGPVFNLILPFFLFFFMFLGDSELLPSMVGSVQKGGPGWNSGMRAGDQVIAIDGQPIEYWWQFQKAVDGGAGREMSFTLKRGGETLEVKATPEPEEVMKLKQVGLTETQGRVRVAPYYDEPYVWVRPGSLAEAAGLRSWDRVVSVDGKPVMAWFEVERMLGRSEAMSLQVLRSRPLGDLGLASLMTVGDPITVVLPEGQNRGVDSAELAVFDVESGSVAEQIGLAKGDRIVSLDGQEFLFFDVMLHYLSEKVGEEHLLVWENGEGTHTKSFSLTAMTTKGEFNEERQVVVFGVANYSPTTPPALVPNGSPLSYALHQTWDKSTEAFTVTVASIYGLFAGQVPMKDLGGPILIYDMAAKTKDYGWDYFANVMAWLSISLGVVNLLPIPMMDGGHLMFFAIEAVMRRPVPNRVREIASYVGLALIALLMITVFFNDIVRKWGLFQ